METAAAAVRQAQPGLLRSAESQTAESQTRRSTPLSTQGNAATAGITMGSALAMILSFQLNHSVLWAIIHGICSWFYVVYRVFKGNY